MMQVLAWKEMIVLPTYETGKAEKNPIFLEKRVYQGSSGVVYPHPVIEKISDEKTDKTYTAYFLENEYLRIMILPELGGRVHRAYDKVHKRDFIYYNQVIKPALVGLAGPWISGGIEFNWPQHHRPSTFEAVDCTIEENADGSKTVWVNEIEVMFHTKGMAGFTLHPDKAYLEIKGRLYNRTPFPQTFLWWANPAVKVNDHYQSVFPPDVYAVFDHGKRDVSDFPIATGTYYKVNYAPGTDISRYKNIPVPTSYMAIQSKFDFIGCYEHDTQAGMLHVANHHISPGKKQWTWGNGDFGKAWDRNLTDEDGPYIELMTGVFTDNQPDFSWIQPNEEKTFEQYFMPYAKIGAVKNATKEAMVNLEKEGDTIFVKIYATASYPHALINIRIKGAVWKHVVTDLSPSQIFEEKFIVPADVALTDIKIEAEDEAGNLLVTYQPEVYDHQAIPPAAVAAKQPADIATTEELYLNGLHLEQYRHATYMAADYYLEALRREPGNIRCNNAMGLLLLRRGQFEKAEPYFRRAIASMTSRNPNPYDGEPYYNLGWSLSLQGKIEEAYDAFYKAVWNDAWQHSGFLSLARIAGIKKQYAEALQLADKSLVRNYNSPVVRHLKVSFLRKLGRTDDALRLIEESLRYDQFNHGCRFEKYLLQQKGDAVSAAQTLGELKALMRDSVQNYLPYALDYAHAGMYDEAVSLLNIYADGKKQVNPLVYYYIGWMYRKAGNNDGASVYYRKATQQPAGYCFPNRIEEVLILQDAISFNSTDAKALYYLGNLWYDKREYKNAIQCWERSRDIDTSFATVHRNLSLAYHNKLGDTSNALGALEKAFALDTADARVLMELDQLHKITGKPIEERLALLEKCLPLVNERDDLYLERITLYNQLGEYEKVAELLAVRKFHPWEGGEGKVVGQYLVSHTELAKKALLAQDYKKALTLLEETDSYPHNLGEGKLYGTQENDLHYLKGLAYEGLKMDAEAKQCFEAATVGASEPVQAIFYNDPQPDKIFYQGLAWVKLGKPEKAKALFQRFIDFGIAHMDDEVKIDYFAVSLPDLLVFEQNLDLRNAIHCNYLIGMGYLGLGDEEKAKVYLQKVLELNINHQGAAIHLAMINFLKNKQTLTSLK